HAPLGLRFLAVTEHGQVDPREAEPVARAPDDVGDVDRLSVVGLGQPVSSPGDAAEARDAGGIEVLRLHPDQRRGLCDEAWADLPSDRRAAGQNVVPYEAHTADRDVAREPRLDAERDHGRLL